MQGKKTEEGIPKLREHVQIRTKSKHVAFSSDDDAVGGHKNPSYVETLLQKQRKKDLATRHKNLRERKSITHTHTHTTILLDVADFIFGTQILVFEKLHL